MYNTRKRSAPPSPGARHRPNRRRSYAQRGTGVHICVNSITSVVVMAITSNTSTTHITFGHHHMSPVQDMSPEFIAGFAESDAAVSRQKTPQRQPTPGAPAWRLTAKEAREEADRRTMPPPARKDEPLKNTAGTVNPLLQVFSRQAGIGDGMPMSSTDEAVSGTVHDEDADGFNGAPPEHRQRVLDGAREARGGSVRGDGISDASDLSQGKDSACAWTSSGTWTKTVSASWLRA